MIPQQQATSQKDSWQSNREELMRQDAERYRQESLRTAIVSYPPRWATVAIGSACTNRCTFCSYHSHDARNGKSNVYNLKYKMSVERFRQHVDFFHAGRVPHVHICATGEPFLHDGIMDMIDYVAERYGKASFQSNFNSSVMERGNYLRKILERKDVISYIVTDLHAGDEGVFDSIKKGSSLKDLLATLRIFSNHGIRIIGSCILSRGNYKAIPKIIDVLSTHRIKMQLNVVGLFPHMFNNFTAIDNVYHKADVEITKSLEHMRRMGEKCGITVQLPTPFDDPGGKCTVFWEKIQIWPVKGIDPARYDENLIPHACNAVVLGDINTLGYASDFPTVMDFWNNDVLVAIRRKILSGEQPDRFCWSCPGGVALQRASNPILTTP
ncbi:radical SAM protein [Desulfomicrobium baculatum]|uniref:Radical SAM domain protein n=1 Tax=Desulfomicrobium baculatum (strain DSM 4028 / VKM B-1378 / X) TaxID=525897 RepID=C7LT25_DESBD|nr:radical SAM protein [Desulfomicrobium baculatum]ACU88249.1 Radical SAM domain protein [Desulfomicrobium baculatum DSM 4028]